jgi:hypothetical protein
MMNISQKLDLSRGFGEKIYKNFLVAARVRGECPDESKRGGIAVRRNEFHDATIFCFAALSARRFHVAQKTFGACYPRLNGWHPVALAHKSVDGGIVVRAGTSGCNKQFADNLEMDDTNARFSAMI